MAVSNTITGALNFAAMVLSVLIIGSGIWLASKQDTECVRFLRWPIITIGVILLLVSAAGFVGSLWRVPYLLVIYLIFMFVLIIVLLALVIFAFVVTNKGGGHAVVGRNYDEYQLNDFSGWLRHYVENTKQWNKIKSCLSSSKLCSQLDQRYPSAQYFFSAHLKPLEVFSAMNIGIVDRANYEKQFLHFFGSLNVYKFYTPILFLDLLVYLIGFICLAEYCNLGGQGNLILHVVPAINSPFWSPEP